MTYDMIKDCEYRHAQPQTKYPATVRQILSELYRQTQHKMACYRWENHAMYSPTHKHTTKLSRSTGLWTLGLGPACSSPGASLGLG